MLTTTVIGIVLVLIALSALGLIAYRNGRRREHLSDPDESDSQSSPN
jgi:hypothetical protein